jgi:tRNA-specific 2-thiouridylase
MGTKKENSCVVGMSGGVDSTAAAYSMLMGGYAVTGVTLRFFSHLGLEAGKRDEAAVEKARKACKELGIRHVVIDAGREFRSRVVEYFIDSYRKGMTPNPCVLCNERIKFPFLAKAADSAGADAIVTGHYSRIIRSGGLDYLASAEYRGKDQSYFLYRVPPRYLSRAVFPNGTNTKDEVRSVVAGIVPGSDVAGESQDVCFLPDNDLERFLSERIDPVRGGVYDTKGKMLGEHRGACFYTIGQRKGLGISSHAPLYVREIDTGRDRIVLAEDREMYSAKAVCRSLRLRRRKPKPPLRAKIRFRHEPAELSEIRSGSGVMEVTFASPQRAVTPGQSLVLYDGDLVVGGGVIEKGD